MIRSRGWGLALCSVVLVSSAQLTMRWSMTRLPSPTQWLQADLDMLALAGVCAGVLAYALSLLCWMGALRDLPLGRAYSLLSASYALVYLGAALLPGFGEPLSLPRTLGVGLVIAGVLTINWRREVRPARAPEPGHPPHSV